MKLKRLQQLPAFRRWGFDACKNSIGLVSNKDSTFEPRSFPAVAGFGAAHAGAASKGGLVGSNYKDIDL